MTLTEIKQALTAHHLRPLDSLGQNFLHDQNICRQIVAWLNPEPGNTVIEIGPGLGALTELLLDLDISLTALEIDKGLARYLRGKFNLFDNFKLVEGDATETLAEPFCAPYVIGNLPYNVSTPLLVKLLEMNPLPRRCVFMLQKELAQRLAAAPKCKEYGAVTILLQSYFRIEPLKSLKGNVFYPTPEVDSVVLRLEPNPAAPNFDPAGRKAFYELVRRGFSQRRKKLRNLIDHDSDKRAEELSVQEWQQVYRDLQ